MAVPDGQIQPGSLTPPRDPRGSRIIPRHTERRVRELLIYESELDQVGLLNTISTALFSASSATLFFVLGLWTNSRMQDELPERADALLEFALPAGLLLTIVFFISGVAIVLVKGSKVGEMKRAAVDIEQPNAPPVPVTPDLNEGEP